MAARLDFSAAGPPAVHGSAASTVTKLTLFSRSDQIAGLSKISSVAVTQLYTIEEKPDGATRYVIWKSKLPLPSTILQSICRGRNISNNVVNSDVGVIINEC